MKTRYLALLCLLVPLAAQARPANEVTTEFYSDASKSTLVGERILTCGGGVAKWGRQTEFSSKTSDSCGNGHRAGISTSIAATSLLHNDPVNACKQRCDKIKLVPLGSCIPGNDSTGPCQQPREVCKESCQTLFSDPQ